MKSFVFLAVRTLSTESVAFVKAMMDSHTNDNERFEKLKAAIEAHGITVKDAMLGRGVDRHLLGLQIAAEVRHKRAIARHDMQLIINDMKLIIIACVCYHGVADTRH